MTPALLCRSGNRLRSECTAQVPRQAGKGQVSWPEAEGKAYLNPVNRSAPGRCLQTIHCRLEAPVASPWGAGTAACARVGDDHSQPCSQCLLHIIFMTVDYGTFVFPLFFKTHYHCLEILLPRPDHSQQQRPAGAHGVDTRTALAVEGPVPRGQGMVWWHLQFSASRFHPRSRPGPVGLSTAALQAAAAGMRWDALSEPMPISSKSSGSRVTGTQAGIAHHMVLSPSCPICGCGCGSI